MLSTLFSIVPSGSTIRIFGLVHLLILSTSLLLAYAMIKYNKGTELLMKVLTLIMLTGFATIYVWYHFSPIEFMIKGLPLYTCRLAVYMLATGLYFNKRFWLKMGCYWGFFGGVAGLMFPSIFEYPFPHVLQITTFYLHVYLIIISTYYLFIDKIGMNKTDLSTCCWFTVGFLVFTCIINAILGSNYSSTSTTPYVLLKLGVSFPPGTSLVIVTFGYLCGIIAEYLLVNKYEEKSSVKSK